jgi:transcriptional regulator with XRE-family HTH domain
MAASIPLRCSARVETDAADTKHNVNAIVGHNLKRSRTRHGYSLERLAGLSSVSRAMLGQIELRRCAPTINLVFKIAPALGVPFSALLADGGDHRARVLLARDSKILTSASAEFNSRALFPFDTERKTEFYEHRLSPNGMEDAEPHVVGALANLAVIRGLVEVGTPRGGRRLTPADAILFEADVPHSYRNLADHEALI